MGYWEGKLIAFVYSVLCKGNGLAFGKKIIAAKAQRHEGLFLRNNIENFKKCLLNYQKERSIWVKK